ncbi:hypothetical protein ABTK12_19485, partial [Acinetobacter baumannii]
PLAGCGLGGFGRLTGRLTGRLLGRLLGAFPGEALGFGPGLGGQARLLGGFPLRMLTGFALRREACLLGFSSLACRPRGGVALGLFAGL